MHNKCSQSSGRHDWLDALETLDRTEFACVLVNVIQTRGSAPREAGAKMLVMDEQCVGTIGGGHLEYKAIEQALKLLADGKSPSRSICRFPLGASLSQCCGGVVELLFEKITNYAADWIHAMLQLRMQNKAAILVSRFPEAEGVSDDSVDQKLIVTESASFFSLGSDSLDNQAVDYARALLSNQSSPQSSIGTAVTTQISRHLLYDPMNQTDFHVILFGAGHVARAVVDVLHNIPCQITWIDSREGVFPDVLPRNVSTVRSDTPEYEIDDSPSGSCVLIMTHSHQLDLAICHRALQREYISFCGLIGSSSKRNRFKKRLLARGLATEALSLLTCPIGVDDITGKQPQQIAISVSAQLLQHVERRSQHLNRSIRAHN